MRISALTVLELLVCFIRCQNSSSSSGYATSSSSATNGMILTDFQKEADELYNAGVDLLENKHASHGDVNRAIELLDKSLQLGNYPAALEITKVLYFGRANFEPDYNRCAIYLEQCLEPECHFLLGLFHEYALGGKSRSIQHALTYYSLAAQRKNTAASIALGYAYSSGVSVAKSCFRSRDYYFPVAKEMAKVVEEKRIRTFPKQTRLTFDKQDRSHQSTHDVIEFYNYNSDPNDANSMVFLGQVYYLGIGGVERDLHQARMYFEDAARLGNASAEGYLGQMDFYGEGIDKPDFRSAYHRFRKAAKDKSPMGLNGMGLLYWKGVEVVADVDEAIKYFKQAAEQENAEASYNLGQVLHEVDPVHNEDKIFSAYLNALRGGFVLAGYELAKLNMGRDLTCGLARFLLQNMLEKHQSLWLHDEGVDLFNAGKYGPALSRFLYFAVQGYEAARFNAAFLLEQLARSTFNNASVRRRALILWSQAADQGDAVSIVKTGDYFYYGWGLESPLPVTAAAYYHKAIEKKSGQAAFNLAYLHEHGYGVPLDFNMARKYYEQSVALGKLEGKPETWFPAYLALKHLAYKQHVVRIKQQLRNLPPWTITMAAIIIFGATILVSSVVHFGLFNRPPIINVRPQTEAHQENNDMNINEVVNNGSLHNETHTD